VRESKLLGGLERKKKTIYGTIIGQISGCGKDNFVFKDLKEILP
jgi:hypothetical protein